MSPTEPPPSSTRARSLLAVGAALGIVLAAASLLARPERGLPDGAMARVNGALIRTEEYQRVVAALATDRRNPLTDADRHRVLDRLVEEELLVQHAVDLGLLETDRRVRADLVTAVLGSLTAAADAYEPSDEEMEAFFAENGDYFAHPARLWVREVFVRGTDADARSRAQQAAERLRAGEALGAVREALGDASLAAPPDAALPPAKLREYLGPAALEAALALAPGEVSEPVQTPQGYHVLQMVENEAARRPALEEVRAQVRAEMKREAGDRALRERLDELRADGDVVTAERLP